MILDRCPTEGRNDKRDTQRTGDGDDLDVNPGLTWIDITRVHFEHQYQDFFCDIFY